MSLSVCSLELPTVDFLLANKKTVDMFREHTQPQNSQKPVAMFLKGTV